MVDLLCSMLSQERLLQTFQNEIFVEKEILFMDFQKEFELKVNELSSHLSSPEDMTVCVEDIKKMGLLNGISSDSVSKSEENDEKIIVGVKVFRDKDDPPSGLSFLKRVVEPKSTIAMKAPIPVPNEKKDSSFVKMKNMTKGVKNLGVDKARRNVKPSSPYSQRNSKPKAVSPIIPFDIAPPKSTKVFKKIPHLDLKKSTFEVGENSKSLSDKTNKSFQKSNSSVAKPSSNSKSVSLADKRRKDGSCEVKKASGLKKEETHFNHAFPKSPSRNHFGLGYKPLLNDHSGLGHKPNLKQCNSYSVKTKQRSMNAFCNDMFNFAKNYISCFANDCRDFKMNSHVHNSHYSSQSKHKNRSNTTSLRSEQSISKPKDKISKERSVYANPRGPIWIWVPKQK